MDERYDTVRVHIDPMRIGVAAARAHRFLRHESGCVDEHKRMVAELDQLVQRPEVRYIPLGGVRGDAERSSLQSRCVESVSVH